MKLILQLDGGGIRGTIPASFLTELEAQFQIKVAKKFDLISGTSTGAILGSCLAVGAPASLCRALYVFKGKELFQARSKLNPFNWLKPKYDRNSILCQISNVFQTALHNPRPKMSDCLTKFMCTAVSLVDARTHFFKSWEKEDGSRDLLNSVAYSFAAAYYFGALDAPDEKQVYCDGGEGQDNCTIRHCVIESLRQSWLPKEPVKILSLGCGYGPKGYTYEQAKASGIIGQAKFYLTLTDYESVADQCSEVAEWSKIVPLQLIRSDSKIPEQDDHLDAIDDISFYDSLGKKLFNDNKDSLTKFFAGV